MSILIYFLTRNPNFPVDGHTCFQPVYSYKPAPSLSEKLYSLKKNSIQKQRTELKHPLVGYVIPLINVCIIRPNILPKFQVAKLNDS